MLNLDYKEVAERYGGNKQKIAQAAALGALGPEGPLLAVTAGMYIDRMRAAQMAEQAPQQTVAQQVLAPQPQPQMMPPQGAPMPQGGPAMPPQGLGAIAPQPEAPMPEMPMEGEGEPMPMAAGGVADLSVPDGMFDEPSDGGFAGGGLVAFATGGSGMADLYDDVEWQESRGRQGAVSPKGARGVMQLMPGTARDPGYGITPAADDSEAENRRVGQQYLDAMFRKYGDKKTALMAYNWGPGNVDKWIKAGKPADRVPAETRNYVAKVLGGKDAPLPERNMQTAQGRASSLEDQVGVVERLYSKLPEDTGKKKAKEYYEKQLDPKEMEKERKNDMWATLAQIGASMASSSSPHFLQAVGQAVSAALPGADASRRERKKAEREAVTALSELYGWERKEAKEKLNMALDLHTAEQRAEGEQTDRAFRATEAAKEREWRSDEARKSEAAAIELAGAKEKGFDALVSANYAKLKREADAGVWKTPMGNKPSEDIIKYWAYQHAIGQWAQRNPGQQQGGVLNAPGLGAQGGAQQQQVVDTNYGSM